MDLPPSLKPTSGPDDYVALAIRAWNLCGGMEWGAIPLVSEILGVHDVERLVYQMTVIRDHMRDK